MCLSPAVARRASRSVLRLHFHTDTFSAAPQNAPGAEDHLRKILACQPTEPCVRELKTMTDTLRTAHSAYEEFRIARAIGVTASTRNVKKYLKAVDTELSEQTATLANFYDCVTEVVAPLPTLLGRSPMQPPVKGPLRNLDRVLKQVQTTLLKDVDALHRCEAESAGLQKAVDRIEVLGLPARVNPPMSGQQPFNIQSEADLCRLENFNELYSQRVEALLQVLAPDADKGPDPDKDETILEVVEQKRERIQVALRTLSAADKK